MARMWLFCALLLIVAVCSFGEEPGFRWTAAFDPVKAVMGLVNFEIEYGFLPRFSTALFAAPRGLLSYAVGQARVIPGFDLLAGILF